MARLNTSGVPLEYVLSRDTAQVAEIAARPEVPVNTDDRPVLEFKAAWNLVVGDLGRLEREESTR